MRVRAKDIKDGSRDAVRDAANLGLEVAQTIVPKYSGQTAQAILSFPESNEVWIIESRPPADHGFFPLNVFLEEGKINALNWRGRTEPATGEFKFMTHTADFLQDELSTRLNLVVERSLK